MIIVLTTLGLTTGDLNSTKDTNTTDSRPPIEFRTVGETATTHSFYVDQSLPGAGPIYMDNIKIVSDHATRTDSSSPNSERGGDMV
jgi:hypothetical protein